MSDRTPAPVTPVRTYAAVDLGSNSFHMIVAELEDGQLRVVDRLREMVRLGEGLDEHRGVRPKVRERALACLSRFGQRLRAHHSETVRAVGTNTLRQIRDGGRFLRDAERALGHSIEIIAGREEARLIYLGVGHGFESDEGRRLVIDIGGGSTELVLGRGRVSGERESLFMGCVTMSRRFFGGGRIDPAALRRAVTAARVELEPIRRRFSSSKWDQAVGSSGSIRSVGDVLARRGGEESILRGNLEALGRAVLDAKRVDRLKLEGLSDERRPVFLGGLAILLALFESLDIEELRVSDSALREGLLYEMVGETSIDEVRDRTVRSFARRFSLDTRQAERVERTALRLLEQTRESWSLDRRIFERLLGWAAQLHEIGLALSHSSFHKHGAYILGNADLPGFGRRQQALLAALVRGHRRSFRRRDFESFSKKQQQVTRRLCVLLRLAVLLHRSRTDLNPQELPEMRVAGKSVELVFAEGWLSEHPLTQAELELESRHLLRQGYRLSAR